MSPLTFLYFMHFWLRHHHRTPSEPPMVGSLTGISGLALSAPRPCSDPSMVREGHLVLKFQFLTGLQSPTPLASNQEPSESCG
jgi:hypothetical protein